MSSPTSWASFKLDTPAIYRIRVQGHLDDKWSDWLSGMDITRKFDEKKQPVTIMIGRLADQAELSGVLNMLYDLHMPLLSAKKLDNA